MKRSQADIWFSKCIRLAANNTCEWCGKNDSLMDCSHVFGRRHRTIRWDVLNAKCLCKGCHRKWHESPAEAMAWFEDKFGKGRIDILIEKKNMKLKVSKLEEKEIASHYKEQFHNLENGIELVSYQ